VNPLAVLAAFLLLLVNGFFVAVEFALVGSRHTRVEELATDGGRRGRVALASLGDLTLQLAGAQLGITLASLALGFVAEPAAVAGLEALLGPVDLPAPVSHGIAVVIGLSIVVFLHLVVGEMAPKGVALADPERTLLLVAVPNHLYLVVFKPAIRLLNASANGLTRLIGVEPRDELGGAPTAEELAVMVSESHDEGLIETFAHDLLTGVLDFGGRDAGSVMVPAASVAWVPRTATAADVEQLVVRSGHSRLPVTDPGGLDEALGFVHSKDLLTLGEGEMGRPLPLRLVRRMLVVPTDRSLEDLLLSMRRARVHVALVVEPGGSAAGLVTLEDLLEELVGDILDESDR
jgi:CBS domain containing-hemolysin-like protein